MIHSSIEKNLCESANKYDLIRLILNAFMGSLLYQNADGQHSWANHFQGNADLSGYFLSSVGRETRNGRSKRN